MMMKVPSIINITIIATITIITTNSTIANTTTITTAIDDHDHLYEIKVEDHHDIIEVDELEDHHIELIKELHGDIHAVVHDPDDHHDHPDHPDYLEHHPEHHPEHHEIPTDEIPTDEIPTDEIATDDAADISMISDDLSPAPIQIDGDTPQKSNGGFFGFWRNIYEFTTCVTVDMKQL